MKIIIPKSSRVTETKEERGEKQVLKRKNDRKLRLKRAKKRREKLNKKVDGMLAVSCFAVCVAAALMEAERAVKKKKS